MAIKINSTCEIHSFYYTDIIFEHELGKEVKFF